MWFYTMVSLSGPQSWINFSHSVAGSATQFSPPNDPFAVPLSAFETDMTVNTTSVFVAAQQAVADFKELPAEVSKTFFSQAISSTWRSFQASLLKELGSQLLHISLRLLQLLTKRWGTSMFAIMIVVAKEYANV
jgi:hypothetical protein